MTEGFETLDSRRVYEGRATVRVDTVRQPDGDHAQREIVEQMEAAAVVPLLPNGEVVLVRQYRQPTGDRLLEIPAGVMDEPGETPDQTAVRELREEVALAPGDITPLTTFWNSAGWSTERTHLYLATDCREVARPDDFVAAHEEADMEIVRLPLHAAVAQVADGRITDAKTVVGLLLAARHPSAG